MKQAEDKYTMDLLGESLTTQDTPQSKYRFRFYIRTTDGNETEWHVGGQRWPNLVVPDLDRAAAHIINVEEPAQAEHLP